MRRLKVLPVLHSVTFCWQILPFKWNSTLWCRQPVRDNDRHWTNVSPDRTPKALGTQSRRTGKTVPIKHLHIWSTVSLISCNQAFRHFATKGLASHPFAAQAILQNVDVDDIVIERPSRAQVPTFQAQQTSFRTTTPARFSYALVLARVRTTTWKHQGYPGDKGLISSRATQLQLTPLESPNVLLAYSPNSDSLLQSCQ